MVLFQYVPIAQHFIGIFPNNVALLKIFAGVFESFTGEPRVFMRPTFEWWTHSTIPLATVWGSLKTSTWFNTGPAGIPSSLSNFQISWVEYFLKKAVYQPNPLARGDLCLSPHYLRRTLLMLWWLYISLGHLQNIYCSSLSHANRSWSRLILVVLPIFVLLVWCLRKRI